MRLKTNQNAGPLLEVVAFSFHSSADNCDYVYSPHLDILRHGSNPAEAEQMFAEAVKLLIQGWQDKGNLHERLLQLGHLMVEAGQAGPATVYRPLKVKLMNEEFSEMVQAGASEPEVAVLSFQLDAAPRVAACAGPARPSSTTSSWPTLGSASAGIVRRVATS